MLAPLKVGDKVTNLRNPGDEWPLEMGVVYVVTELVGVYQGVQTVKLDNHNVYLVNRLKKHGKWWKE